MAFARPFAYNLGTTIPGTEQVGDLSIGAPTSGFTSNPQYWNGPDEELGYVIAQSVPDNSQPTPIIGVFASVGFYRSKFLTEESFVELVNRVFNQSFANGGDAKTWLNDNGYWTSYGLTIPLTITLEGFYFEGSVGAGYQAIANQVLNDDVSISFTNVLGTITGPPLLISGSVVILSGQTSGYTQTFTDYDYNDLTQESSFTGITFNVTGSTEYGFTSEISGSTFDVTPTPTPTNTETPSITLTGETQTPTPTGTPTGTPVAETPTPTPTETEVLTPTPTETPTPTPTETEVLTPTPTETETPTPTPTGTPESETPTPTTTSTPTPTPTSGATGNFTVTVSQVGPDVVWSGSGSFNTTSLISNGTDELTAGFSAPNAAWAIGDPTPPGPTLDIYSGVTTFPTSFGTAGGTIGTPSGSGDNFGILPNGTNRNLLVPTGYTSGSFISGTTTYAGATIDGMNLIPGTYTWAWGSGGTASSLVMTIESAGVTPTPTPTGTPVAETPTPTETETPTPTPTGTPAAETPTPTPTETEVLTPTPTETETPTPTPTGTPEAETPTPTPTPTGTPEAETPTPTETETPTPTPTSTDLSSITTYSISGCTNLNVLVVDLGPGFIVPGDVNYYTFTGATPSGCYSVIGKINAPIDDAFTASFGYGGCNDCEISNITPTPTETETPTPTPTETEVLTPTPTETETPTPTPTETEVLTPTPTETETPTPTPTETEVLTPTPTETETPTPTPTPSTTPIPVTGYGYNLVVLPYDSPTSGNTIFPRFTVTGETSGVTTPNTFDVNGVFWNSIDNLSVDRTSYYSGMTGTSVTAYFTQNGDTAIYSGSSTAFTFEGSPGTFNYNPNTRPGQLTLIQSASTDFVTGQTVYISYVAN